MCNIKMKMIRITCSIKTLLAKNIYFGRFWHSGMMLLYFILISQIISSLLPSSPCSPLSPSLPSLPSFPGKPILPTVPGAPGAPGGPGGPGGPGRLHASWGPSCSAALAKPPRMWFATQGTVQRRRTAEIMAQPAEMRWGRRCAGSSG